MELIEGLSTRTSIRAFIKKAVAKDVIAEILGEAHRAPSSSKQQAWNFHVITGTPLAALCAKILAARETDRKPYDPSKGKTILAQYVERTKTLFSELRPFLQKLGEENRSFIETGSLCFYSAPVAILLTIHNSFPRNRLMDIGMAAQNLMLAAHGHGLGTCAIGLALYYEDVVRTEMAIPPACQTQKTISKVHGRGMAKEKSPSCRYLCCGSGFGRNLVFPLPFSFAAR